MGLRVLTALTALTGFTGFTGFTVLTSALHMRSANGMPETVNLVIPFADLIPFGYWGEAF